jgi:hypothetical protein
MIDYFFVYKKNVFQIYKFFGVKSNDCYSFQTYE